MTLLATRLNMPDLAGLRNLGFKAGAAFSFSYPSVTLRSEDVTVGVTMVSAELTIRPGVGQIPTLTKGITTASTSDGQITDNGATDGVGALHIDVSSGESTGWTARQVFAVTVTDSLGRVTTLDSGYLVPVTGLESDYALAERVVISPTLITIALGVPGQLSAVAVDDTATPLPDHAIIWTSTDTGIITVSSEGVVTAVALGTASVFATSDFVYASATVVVADTGAVSDTFTRPEDPASLGTADTGQIWRADRGVWGIDDQNHAAVTTPTGTDYDHASVEVGYANVSVTVKATVMGAFAATCRLIDADSHIKLEYQGSGADQFVIIKRDGNLASETVLASGTSGLLVAGDTITLTANGNSLSGYANGVLVVGPVTDVFNNTETRCGMASYNSTAVRLDNVLVMVL